MASPGGDPRLRDGLALVMGFKAFHRRQVSTYPPDMLQDSMGGRGASIPLYADVHESIGGGLFKC